MSLLIAVTLSRGATGRIKFIFSLPSRLFFLWSLHPAGFLSLPPKLEKFLPHLAGGEPHLNTPHKYPQLVLPGFSFNEYVVPNSLTLITFKKRC